MSLLNESANHIEDLKAKVIAQQARISQLREAVEYKHDSLNALMEWCVKNVKKWNFPEWDDCDFAISKMKQALSTSDDLSALKAYDEERDNEIVAQQARIVQLKSLIANWERALTSYEIQKAEAELIIGSMGINDNFHALRAHDEKLLVPYQWQPIKTAPRDGTEVILWFPHKNIAINGHYGKVSDGDWESGYSTWMEWLVADELWFQEDPSEAPTHWMPLLSTDAIEKCQRVTR